MVHRQSSRGAGTYRNDAAFRARRAPSPLPGEPQAAQARALPHAGRNGIFLAVRSARPFALPQGPSLRSSREWKYEPRWLRARRILDGRLRRKFELARARLVSGQLLTRGIPPEISPLLRRRFQSRMPHALAFGIRFVASSRGNFTPSDPHFSPRFEWPPARCGWRRALSERSALARPYPFLRILSRRQWRRDGRKPSNRLDRPGRKIN